MVNLLRWVFYNRGKLEKKTNCLERLGRVDNLLRMAGGRGAAAFCGDRVILGEKASQEKQSGK